MKIGIASIAIPRILVGELFASNARNRKALIQGLSL